MVPSHCRCAINGTAGILGGAAPDRRAKRKRTGLGVLGQKMEEQKVHYCRMLDRSTGTTFPEQRPGPVLNSYAITYSTPNSSINPILGPRLDWIEGFEVKLN